MDLRTPQNREQGQGVARCMLLPTRGGEGERGTRLLPWGSGAPTL